MRIFGQRDLLVYIVRLFSRYRIDYLLTGSFAVSYYGYPRATHDIDFVIQIIPESLAKIKEAMKNLGNDFMVDINSIEESAKKQTMFNIYHVKTGIKVDFWIVKKNEFQSKLKRAHKIIFDKQVVHVISAEDLILTKLKWCKEVMSERHMRDCVGIWDVQKNVLDKEYINLKAKEIGVSDFLNEIAKPS